MSNRIEHDIRRGWDPVRGPLLSILCPAYNQQRFIAQTLDSFLAQQTSFAFEILVNDDASTDGTTAIIADYAQRYPNIIRPIFHTQNQYQQGKLFFPDLFNRAQGKYLAYCDGDDYWTDPLKLQKQVDFLEANPDYVITYHDALITDDQGSRGVQLSAEWQCDASRMDLLRGRRISTLTTCFRNVLHELPRELEQAPLLDVCWWSMLGAHGKGKYMRDIAPGAYRVHNGGMFSMRAAKHKLHMSLQTYASLANYYQRQGDQALYEYYLVQVFGLSLSAVSPVQKLNALLLVARNVIGNLFKRLTPSASRG